MDGRADITSRLCFASLIILYRISDYKNTKTLSKISSLLRWIMHQSFVPPPPPPPPPPRQYTHTQTENSGDNGFSSITAMGPAERHSPALYNNKFNGKYMHNITSSAAGELKRPMSRTLAPLSPAHPRRCVCWGGGRGEHQWLQMTGALWINLPKFGEVKKKGSSRLNVHLIFPLFPTNLKSIP